MTGAQPTAAPGTVRNVSDTARWAAYFRALETARPDALFRDRFAERLCGQHGVDIANTLPDGNKHAWAWVTRTYLFDHFIKQELQQGADLVLNLAAGLDARPYRLELPASLQWIGVDPLQRRRQFQAVWPRIENRGKVQHQVRALLQLLFDEMVEEVSSRDPGPGVLVSVGKRVRDVDPVLATQTLSKPIAEERVRPRCFLRAKIRRPSRGIGNVSHGSWCCRWLRPGHQILHVQPIRISFCKNILRLTPNIGVFRRRRSRIREQRQDSIRAARARPRRALRSSRRALPARAACLPLFQK